jgi:hypothetical protein
MGKVQGVKEKLHFDWYDCFFVPIGQRFAEALQDPRVIRYFVDVQSKTRLETNMQAAGVLPSQNTFETRAMRVVASSMDERQNHDIFSPHDGVTVTEADVLAELIYDSVTALLVGEKVMFEAPTFFFPSGAGVIQNGGGGNITVANHGQPDPMATFRFAEPVMIDCQQNFRVEISFPRGIPGQNGVTGSLANLLGPFRLWVMLDGYLTRDVQ